MWGNKCSKPMWKEPAVPDSADAGSNLVLILIWVDLMKNKFIFVCGLGFFFPFQGVWLGQRGTGRKGEEKDEGLLWALPKVWAAVSRTNLEISMIYISPFLSPSLIHGGHKMNRKRDWYILTVWNAACLQKIPSKNDMSGLVFRKRAMRRVPKDRHHEADWENTSGSDNTDTEGSWERDNTKVPWKGITPTPKAPQEPISEGNTSLYSVAVPLHFTLNGLFRF